MFDVFHIQVKLFHIQVFHIQFQAWTRPEKLPMGLDEEFAAQFEEDNSMLRFTAMLAAQVKKANNFEQYELVREASDGNEPNGYAHIVGCSSNANGGTAASQRKLGDT